MPPKHTVEVIAGERYTAFHIRSRINIGRLVGLPNPVLFASEEPDAVEVLGLYNERDDASIITYESQVFGEPGIKAEDFAAHIVDHLSAAASEDSPSASA